MMEQDAAGLQVRFLDMLTSIMLHSSDWGEHNLTFAMAFQPFNANEAYAISGGMNQKAKARYPPALGTIAQVSFQDAFR